MTTNWRERHRIASLLTEHYPDVRRLDALANSAGLTLSPPQGFAPLFVAASRLLLEAGDALPGLLEKAAEAHEAFAAWGPQPEPQLEDALTQVAETVSEDAVPAPRPVSEAEPGTAPRPAGTPAQAPPLEGVETWVARHIDFDLPDTLPEGQEATLTLRFRAPDGEAVGGAPAGHTAYVGESFPVDLEITVVGGGPAEAQQTMRIDPVEKSAEASFVVTPADDSKEIVVSLRCFSGGYEVGRGRIEVLVPSGDRTYGGALAVPDTVLEQINEDAIKTVKTPTT